MKKIIFILLTVLVLSTMLLAACGGKATESVETGDEEGVPAEFANKTNPYAGQADAASAGEAIFQGKCTSCHGDGGKGDGVAAGALNPKPTDLTTTSDDSDGLLYWRISEGGMMAPFNSQMPAWKGSLSEEEIWQVVTYIRTLK